MSSLLPSFTQNTRPPTELAMALSNRDWTRASNVLQSTPNLAATQSVLQGFFEGLKDAAVLPLHQACSYRDCPVDIIQQLIAAYPVAVQQAETSYQRLPLHCACRTAATLEVVQMLLHADATYCAQQQPGSILACLQPDALGRLPLHYALSNSADLVVVQQLIHAAPAAAQGVDTRGWMPLHVAASMGCSLAVLKAVHDAYPTAVVMRTLQGSSVMRCLHKTVPHAQQLKAFLKQAKQDYEASTGPLGNANQDNKMNNKSKSSSLSETRQVHRAMSSPPVIMSQNPFDDIMISSTSASQQQERGVGRALSHESHGIAVASQTTATHMPAARAVSSSFSGNTATQQQPSSSHRTSSRRSGKPRKRSLPVHTAVLV